MSDSVYETLSNLSSDKITIRTKGRKSCSELIKGDFSGEIFVTNEQWKDILIAALDGASKDADASLKKDKSPDVEVAVLMRKLVKHIVQGSIWIPMKRFESAAKHCLQVLHATFSAHYKDEYKHVLCEILEPKISHCLPFEYIKKILSYMRDHVFINQRTNSENTNLKLLKQYCKALFTDECGSTELLETLLNWFSNSLLPSVRDNLPSLAIMTATIAECCAYIIQYQGLNCTNIFFKYSKNIIVAVIRQLSINQLRDSQRDSYLRLLFSYIKLSTSMNMSDCNGRNEVIQISQKNDFLPLSEMDPLNQSLGILCDILTTDDALRSLVVYAYNQVRQSHPKNSYVNSLSDNKVQSNLQVTAMLVVLHQQQYAFRNFESSADNIDPTRKLYTTQRGSSSSSSSGGGINDENNMNSNKNHHATPDNQSLNGKRIRGEYSDTEESCTIPKTEIGFADIILQKIQKFTFSSSANSNLNSNSNSNSNLHCFKSTPSSIQEKHIASASLEGLLMLLEVMTKLYPKGEFLRSRRKNRINKFDKNNPYHDNNHNNDKKKDTNNMQERKISIHHSSMSIIDSDGCFCEICETDSLLKSLSKWIYVVSVKLFETLPLLDEQQLQGSILLALNGLALITKEIFNDIKKKKNIDNTDEKFISICELWTQILTVILTDNAFNRHLKNYRKYSMGECAFKLIDVVIRFDLINLSSRISILNKIQNLSGFQDSRNVNSPDFLYLFSAMILKGDLNDQNSLSNGLINLISNSTYTSRDVRSLIDYNIIKSKIKVNEKSFNPNFSIFQYLSIILNYSNDANDNQNENNNKYQYENENKYDNENVNVNTNSKSTNFDRGLIYIICFLDQQINDISSRRLTVQSAGDLCQGLNEILFFSLLHDDFAPSSQEGDGFNFHFHFHCNCLFVCLFVC